MHPRVSHSGRAQGVAGAAGVTLENSVHLYWSNPVLSQRESPVLLTSRTSKGATFTRLISYRECEIEVVVKAEAGQALGGVYNRYRVAWKIFRRGRTEEIASFPENFYFTDEDEALNCGEKRARVFIDSLHSVYSIRQAPALCNPTAN